MGRNFNMCVCYLACPSRGALGGLTSVPWRLPPSTRPNLYADTAMFHVDPLLDNPDFRDRVLRDLEYGRQVSGTPLVVAQLAGNVPERVVDAGKIVARYVDALGEISLAEGTSPFGAYADTILV